MATFNFNAKRVNAQGHPMVSGRELLIRKAAKAEAARLAQEKAAAESSSVAVPAKSAPETIANKPAESGRKPIIPSALAPTDKATAAPAPKAQSEPKAQTSVTPKAQAVPASDAALPSQVMDERVRVAASVMDMPITAATQAPALKTVALKTAAEPAVAENSSRAHGVRHGDAPYLECSSKGDQRFSAFYAQVRARGGKSIESLYQAAKVFEDGTTGLGWKEAKGRACVNQEEVRALYAQLWVEYIDENPHLKEVLVEATGLSDLFGQEGHACQATELWRIRERTIQERAERQSTAPLQNPDVIVPANRKGNPDVLVAALNKGADPAPATSGSSVGIPAPKSAGFSFKGAASSAEDFAAMGMEAPPDVKNTDSIPAHLNVPDDAFLYAEAPQDDAPVFDENGQPILAQRGIKRAPGLRMIAGIPATTFEEWEPNVPPGSHYDEWVWNAMDKEGHVTIELYVDARHLKNGKRESVLERAYGTNPSEWRPVFDPAFHVLISVPQPDHAPWRDATRVLLVPQTIKVVQNQARHQGAKPQFPSKAPEPVPHEKEKIPPKPTWESEPSGISAWLNRDPHHNVIFGRVAIDVADVNGSDMYWMVLSRNDAERVHKQVYGADPNAPLDYEHKFGLEGLVHWSSEWDPVRRQRASGPVAIEDRHPVPPAKRYLGHWSDAHARHALALARAGTGPQLPGWPEEDVQVVLQSHAALAARANQKEASTAQAVPTPRSAPAVALPPAKKKKDEPVNRMRMRAAY